MIVRPFSKNLFFQSAQNYESYLSMMKALVFILTDENPEIRLFMINQGLNQVFGVPTELVSPALKGISMHD